MFCTDEARFVAEKSIAADGGGSLRNPDFPLPAASAKNGSAAARELRRSCAQQVPAMQVFPVARCKSLHSFAVTGASHHRNRLWHTMCNRKGN